MNQIENELFLFEGNIAKIVIESEDSMYYPPAPGQEIRQRLALNRNGSVEFTRWYSGDFSVVPPVTEESKVMREKTYQIREDQRGSFHDIWQVNEFLADKELELLGV